MSELSSRSEEFASHLKTIEQLAEYLEELQQVASGMTEVISTNEQGLFRPDQEFQVLTLLIGYWQSRAALLELIQPIRDDERLYGPHGDVLFLVGFSAALILVDSARFLRETVQDRPIVQRKLNEAQPEFGIPANVYDTVQKSLLSARHAWHLYHAIKFYRDNEQRLLALGDQDPALRPMLDLIDRLKYRLDVPIAQFEAARLRTRAGQIVRRLRKSLLGRAIYGLQKLGGLALSDHYLKKGHQPGMPEPVCEQVTGLLRPGDVLAVRKEYALTNYFLPGYWPHVALYLGDAAQMRESGLAELEHIQRLWSELAPGGDESTPRVLESKKDGVLIRSLESPYASDSIIVLRPKLERAEIAEALSRGLKHTGKGYDFGFDFSRANRLVCTEVVYRSFDGVGNLRFPLVKRAGRMTLSGNDLVTMSLAGQFFDAVAVYAPMYEPHLCTEQQVQPLAQLCMQTDQE
jgi:hypothetical protein